MNKLLMSILLFLGSINLYSNVVANIGNGAFASVHKDKLYAVNGNTGKAQIIATIPGTIGGVATNPNGGFNSLAINTADGILYFVSNPSSSVAVFGYNMRTDTFLLIEANMIANRGVISLGRNLGSGGGFYANGRYFFGVERNGGGNSAVYSIATNNNGTTFVGNADLEVNSYAYQWGDFAIDGTNGIMYTGSQGIGYQALDLGVMGTVGDESVINSNPGASFGQIGIDLSGDFYFVFGNTAGFASIDLVTGATGTGKSITVNGVSAPASGSYDAGGIIPYDSSIGDFVWYDLNGDGIQDAGETGVSGVTIELYDDIDADGIIDNGGSYNNTDTLLATDTTDASGNYKFEGLIPGSYIIKITDANGNLSLGSFSTAGGDTQTAVITQSQQFVDTADFGYHIAKGSVTGTVLDSGSNPIVGAQVKIVDSTTGDTLNDINGNPLLVTVNPVDGTYSFVDVPVGDYNIVEINPVGYGSMSDLDSSDDSDSVNNANTNDDSIPTTVTDGEVDADNNFVDNKVGAIAGTIYEDSNGNGMQDAGEPGIPNVVVNITDVNGQEQALTTDTNGNYAGIVPIGNTIVDIDETTLSVGVNTQTEGTDSTIVIVPEGGIGSDIDGYKPAENTGTVEGVVYVDKNGDGAQNPGEVGIPGVTITVTDENGNPQTVVTDENGEYSVTVPAGETVVDVDETTLPGGSTQTGGTDTTTVTVVAGEIARDEDGYQPPVNGGTVEGIIYEDINGNGTQDTDEVGIAGVRVTVTDATGSILTLITDENGKYSTVVPAGITTLTVDESTLPGGSAQTEGSSATSVTVPTGGKATDVDGYQPSSESGKLQGVVYEDTNGNGTQNIDEPGIKGVTVTITDSEGRMQTLSTDIEGKYSVTVLAGDTLVDIEQSDIDGTFSRTEGTDPTIVNVPVGGIGEDIDGFKPAGNTNDNHKTATPTEPAIIDLTVNDNDINTNTINLVPPAGIVGSDTDDDGDIDEIIVPNEGKWTLDENGTVTFTPNNGFTGDPTPIKYTATDNNGNLIDASNIVVDYEQELRDDAAKGIIGNPISLNILDNDDDINKSSINFDPTSVSGIGEDTDGDGDIDKVTVDGEGVWRVDENGLVIFTPEEGFVDNPTPMSYGAYDKFANNISSAVITFQYGPSIVATDDGIITITHYNATDITTRVLGNDEYEGNITINIIEQPKHGTVKIIYNDEGLATILYYPEADYNKGKDNFSYSITDVNGQSANARVSLDIDCASSQTSDSGDAMGRVSILMMMFFTLLSGLYFVRKEDERGES